MSEEISLRTVPRDLFPNDNWLTLPQLKALALAHGVEFSDTSLWSFREIGCRHLPKGRTLKTKEDPRNKRWNLNWKKDVIDVIANVIATMIGEASQPAGRAFFTRAEMRAMGVNAPKNLTSYSNSDKPRGWRIRSKSDGDGESQYHVEDVKERIEVLKLDYSSARSFKDGDITWVPGPLLAKGGHSFPKFADKKVKFDQGILHKWHVKGCNLLGWKLSERDELAICADDTCRRVHFYREDELTSIETAKAGEINKDRVRTTRVLAEFPSLTMKRINQAVAKGFIEKPYDARVKVQFRSGTTIQKKETLSRSQLAELAKPKARPGAEADQGEEEPDPIVATEKQAVVYLGLTTARELRKWSTVPQHPTAKGNHRKNKKEKPRGYRSLDGRLLVIRASWRKVDVKGFDRNTIVYRWDDLKIVKDAMDAWAAAAAKEPYVFPGETDDPEHRWHRLRRLAMERMAHLQLTEKAQRRLKTKKERDWALARLRYSALLGRLKSRKPQDRPWHKKKVPGDQHEMRWAIREDELPILFAPVTPVLRDPKTRRFVRGLRDLKPMPLEEQLTPHQKAIAVLAGREDYSVIALKTPLGLKTKPVAGQLAAATKTDTVATASRPASRAEEPTEKVAKLYALAPPRKIVTPHGECGVTGMQWRLLEILDCETRPMKELMYRKNDSVWWDHYVGSRKQTKRVESFLCNLNAKLIDAGIHFSLQKQGDFVVLDIR